MSTMLKVLADIRAERARQDTNWGGATHDDDHRPEMWDGLIWRYFRAAADTFPRDTRAYEMRRHRLIQVAALCVAHIESMDRAYTAAEAQPK